MRPCQLVVMALSTTLLLGALAGCSEDPPPVVVTEAPADDVGYAPGSTDVVITDDSTWVVNGGGAPLNCVTLKDGTDCVDLDQIKRDRCGDTTGQVDVVIIEGKLVDVICYPPQSSGVDITTVQTDGENAEVPQNASKTVVTFNPATDGTPIKGNVRIDAENVSIIGNGVDKTIIDGDLHLASNNAHVRGLTVTGNVQFENNSNGDSIAFVKIGGNLEVNANNISVLSCTVFGNLQVNGNGAVLVNNAVAKSFKPGGGPTCSGNLAFSDDNANGLLDPTEKGAALTCTE